MEQARTLLIALLLLACFLATAVFRSGFDGINQSVDLWAASVNGGSFTFSAKVISVVFDTNALVVLSFGVAVLFFVLHHGRYGLLLLSGMTGNALLVEICKALVESPRPLNEIIAVSGHSFPSGHVAATVVFFGVLTYFAWKHWNTMKVKVSTGVVYVSVVAIVGFDRVYLNVHWFSDIVGAVFLGGFWLATCLYLFTRARVFRRADKLEARQTWTQKQMT